MITEKIEEVVFTHVPHKPCPEENFEEFLATLPKDSKIKVGSRESAGFYYIGPLSKFDIKLENRVAKGHLEELKKKAYKETENMIRLLPTYSQFIMSLFKTTMKDIPKSQKVAKEEYEKDQEKRMTRIIARNSTYEALRDYLNEYVDFSNRKVYDHYKSTTDPNCEIIILEGMEEGYWWDEEEMKKFPEGVNSRTFDDVEEE